jgi:hypothetical protein
MCILIEPQYCYHALFACALLAYAHDFFNQILVVTLGPTCIVLLLHLLSLDSKSNLASCHASSVLNVLLW